MRTRHRSVAAFAVSAQIIVGILLTAAPASAAPASGEVTRMTFTVPTGLRATATVDITFDRPISAAAAAEIREDTAAVPAGQATTVEHITCGQEIVRSDTQGGASLRYECHPLYGVLNWFFRLSPALQATVVGTVDERGVSWWRNGVEQPQNGQHLGIPADYLMHGSLLKVWNGDVVDYQDYVSWQHNIGTGGRIAVVFAGSVALG
jgi:hypothetical protein